MIAAVTRAAMFLNLGTYPKGLMQRSETSLGEFMLKPSTNLQPIIFKRFSLSE
jgi:hypothetical protein